MKLAATVEGLRHVTHASAASRTACSVASSMAGSHCARESPTSSAAIVAHYAPGLSARLIVDFDTCKCTYFKTHSCYSFSSVPPELVLLLPLLLLVVLLRLMIVVAAGLFFEREALSSDCLVRVRNLQSLRQALP